MLRIGQVIDRYTVEADIGEGGVATVYRVRHNTLGSQHALKILHLHNPAIRERLVQEGRVQATLKHPNIVTVTDVIDVEGAPGLVMEYIAGLSLDRWLAANRPTLAQAEELFRGILAGVARAHRVGLIHRDLKPGNVLLEQGDEGLVPKVADFGLAKILAEEEGGGRAATRSGVTMGTPAYMAPEQVRDAKNVDRRADVFALGCILYELCCGQSPFDGPDVLAIFSALASGTYTPPEQVNPDIPVRIRNTIVGCLSNHREERIPDCATLRSMLDGTAMDAWPTLAPTPVEELRAKAASMSPRTFSLPDELLIDDDGNVSRFSQGGLGGAVPAGPVTVTPPAMNVASRTTVPPPPVLPPFRTDLGRSPPSIVDIPAPRRSSPLVWLGIVGAVLMAFVGVLAIGGWSLWASLRGREGVETPVVETPTASTSASTSAPTSTSVGTTASTSPTASTSTSTVGTPASASASTVGTPTTASTGTPTSTGSTSSRTPVTATATTTTATTTKAATPPPATATGTVAITGDAAKVWLEGVNGTVAPGAIAPGEYKVRATFGTGAPVSAGRVTVRAGATTTIDCMAAFQMCKTK